MDLFKDIQEGETAEPDGLDVGMRVGGGQVFSLGGWVGGKAIHRRRTQEKMPCWSLGDEVWWVPAWAGLSRRGGSFALSVVSSDSQQRGPPSTLKLPFEEALRTTVRVGERGQQVSVQAGSGRPWPPYHLKSHTQ